AVVRLLGGEVHADRAGGAGLRLDDHLLAPELGQFRAVDARHQVGAAARRIGHDQPYGLSWKRLGNRNAAEKEQSEKERSQWRLFHSYPSIFISLMIGRNCSTWRFRIASCSAGVEPAGSAPNSARRSAMSGCLTAVAISFCSRAI